MRVTLLITMGIERPSGRRYFHIARELVRRGHTVRVLALHPDLAGCRRRRFVRDGVEVWYVGQMHARKSGSLPERFGPLELLRVLAGATLGMIWGILCSPADVYHLGKPQPVNGIAALIGIMLLRRRRFYVDCDDDEVGSNRLNAGWQRAVFAFWQWLLPRLAAGVTVNTRFLAERAGRAGVARVVYVPNGVDLERFQPPPAAVIEALRAALGLAGRRVVAYAGTLALQNHPVDLLVDAFARLATDMPDAALLLIGGGEDLPALRRKVERLGLRGRVLFTGQVTPGAVPAYLALAQASADPVEDDQVARARSPLKIVESMALGVPVVTGDVGDRALMLDGGRAGVLVRPGDAGALAAAIGELLTDESGREQLVSAGRRHVRRFAWPVLAAAWERIYTMTEANHMHFASYYRWLVYRHLFGAPQPARTLLDVGCDDGGFVARIPAQTSVALDLNLQSLRTAPTSQKVCADGTRMPFRAATFDMVVLSDVIEHVADDQALVANAAGRVGAGGVLWLSTTAARFQLFPPLATPRAERSWGHVRKGYTPERLRELVGADFECDLVEWPEMAFRFLYILMWLCSKRAPRLAHTLARLCFALDSRLRFAQFRRGHLYLHAVRRRSGCSDE